ncbi:hypothetical protein LCL85_09685 [Vibrio alginolyticus]|nr:hypothetical protein [Vibrio alginolyticus]
MSDEKEEKLTLEVMHKMMNEAMQEKSIASVMLSENGSIIVQYGDKIKVYQNDTSAKPASELFKIVSDFIN